MKSRFFTVPSKIVQDRPFPGIDHSRCVSVDDRNLASRQLGCIYRWLETSGIKIQYLSFDAGL